MTEAAAERRRLFPPLGPPGGNSAGSGSPPVSDRRTLWRWEEEGAADATAGAATRFPNKMQPDDRDRHRRRGSTGCCYFDTFEKTSHKRPFPLRKQSWTSIAIDRSRNPSFQTATMNMDMKILDYSQNCC